MLDMPLEVQLAPMIGDFKKEFQSFLCWICLWKKSHYVDIVVSEKFQSFLCWICLWKGGRKSLIMALKRVSILLMLDMPLEVKD